MLRRCGPRQGRRAGAPSDNKVRTIRPTSMRRRAVNRGFFSGIFWGLIISVLLLAVASLNGPLPGEEPPDTGTAEVPAGSAFNGAREDNPAVLPGREAVPRTPEAESPPVPQPDAIDSIGTAATTPVARPETGAPETALVTAPPAAVDGEMPDGSRQDAPVAIERAETAPAAPGSEAGPSAVPQPAQPPVIGSDVTAPDGASAGESVGFPSQDLQAAAEGPAYRPAAPAPSSAPRTPVPGDTPRADTATLGSPSMGEGPAAPRAMTGDTEAPAMPGGEAGSVAGAAPVRPAPAQGEGGAPDVASTAAPVPEPSRPAASADAPDTAAPSPTPDAASEPPRVTVLTDDGAAEQAGVPGRPAARLTDNAGARSSRLPSISSGSEAAQTPDPAPEPADDPSLPPIERYALDFDNPEDKPLMSIVLMDDGTGRVDATALAEFPYPLTIAVDAEWDGAAQAMKTYRAAGFEVMMLVGLPASATARDAETAFEVWRARLPQVVGVMEKPGLGLQGAKPAGEQLAGILASSGHGLLLYPNGFDTLRKMAAQDGVPAATLFRDFDAADQDPDVIRRFLDHAAFRARQSEGVVMAGRLRPETVQALLLWGLQDRASSVALAPISALLRAQPAVAVDG